MKVRQAELSEEAKKLFIRVNDRVKSSEYRRILDYLIKQQMQELENIEVRVNQELMEKLNKMLMGEISKFKAILKENNVFSENDTNHVGGNLVHNQPRKNTRDSNDQEMQNNHNFKKKNNQTIVGTEEDVKGQNQRAGGKSQEANKSPTRHQLNLNDEKNQK